MTAACCGQCRHIRICRDRCGFTLGAGAGTEIPPQLPREHGPSIGPGGMLAILGGVTAFGLPLWSLMGMLP